MPSVEDLAFLARHLNSIAWHSEFARNINDNQKRAEKVKDAIFTIDSFFEIRKKECLSGMYGADTIKAEENIYNAYQTFLDQLDKHDFSLNMDANLLANKKEGWRRIAYVIGNFFKLSMNENNRDLGFSNDGPVARFCAAVIPIITDEHPSVANVAKHLKDQERFRRRGTKAK